MNRFFFIILIVIIFVSCNNKDKKNQENTISIEVKITNGKNKPITLQILKYNDKQSVDSLIIKEDGIITFTIKPEEKSIFLLKKDDNHYITIIADKGDKIILTADYNDFDKKYSIEGSEDSKFLCELNNHLQINQQKLDSIGEIWKTAINKPDRIEIKQKLDSAYFKAIKDQRDFQIDFVNKHSNTLAALIALYLPLGREAVINESIDFMLFEKVSRDISKTLPDNSHAINFAKRFKQKKMLNLEKELSEKEHNKN